MRTYVFDDSMKGAILSMFNKSVDDEGYIIENDTQERVISPSGNAVLVADFAGFAPGSEIVLTNDLPTLLQYANEEGL